MVRGGTVYIINTYYYVYTGAKYLDLISEIWIPESVGDEKSIVAGPHKKRFGNTHKNIVRIVPALLVYRTFYICIIYNIRQPKVVQKK